MKLIFPLLISMIAASFGCKTSSTGEAKLRDATMVDKEVLPPVKYAYWVEKDWVYRGYCSWASAPYDRNSCTQNVVKIPVKQLQTYFQKLDVMPDGYPQGTKQLTQEQKQAATAELLTALQERRELTWLPMQRRVPEEARGQIKLSDDAILLASRINQCFLGVGETRAVMPPFMVSIYELTGRGAIKIGLRNGLAKGQSVIVNDGKVSGDGDKFLDLYKEIQPDNGARPATCQLFNTGSAALPGKSILFVSGWDRQNPEHADITAFRLYKDPLLTQETGYMSCVGAFSESNGQPAPVFPLGELLSVFKNESDFILQGYME